MRKERDRKLIKTDERDVTLNGVLVEVFIKF